MAGNLNSGMCSPLCSDVCAFYLPQGLTAEIKMDAAHVSMCLAIFKLMCNRSLNNEVIVLSICCLPL